LDFDIFVNCFEVKTITHFISKKAPSSQSWAL